MASQPPSLRPLDNAALLVGRVALGAIFVESGLRQLGDVGAFAASLASRGVPLSMVLAVMAVAVEVVGGIFIIAGFRTRDAAPPVIAFMIVATLLSHRFWDMADTARRSQEIQFYKNISIIGGLLILFVTGPGRFSIDGMFRRK
jgi:putative oxidoreductase